MDRLACFFFLLFLSMQTASGQSPRTVLEIHSVYPVGEINSGNHLRNVLDTVKYPSFGDECTLELVTVGLEGWGRISGMNSFGDLEKAQRLEFTGSSPYVVVGALVFFEKPAIVGDGTVNCKIYTVDPTRGGPSLLKGFSNGVKMSEIIPPDSIARATPFSFEDGVVVELNEPQFFVSVDFSNLYGSRDTLVILQTIPECGDGGNSWELLNDGVNWLPISSSFTWGMNADFIISAVVDFNEPTSSYDFIASNGLKIHPVFPNPAREKIQLNFTIEKGEKLQLQIYNTLGILVDESDLGFRQQGFHSIELNTAHYPAGQYFYRINTETASISSQFEVAK